MDETTKNIKDSLEARKKALKAELEKLEGDIGDSFTDIKDDVTDQVDPRRWVQNHPLKVVGVAVLLGFLAGNKDDSGRLGRVTVVGSIVAALKTYAARKAVDQVVDFVEGMDSRKNRK